MVLKKELGRLKPWGTILIPEGGMTLPLPDGQELELQLDGDRLHHRVVIPGENSDSDFFNVTILSGPGKLRFEPLLPDLPVILRAAHELRILPSGSMETLVPVPLVPALTLELGGRSKRKITVLEVPLQSISKSWFGDPISGEPAYGMNSLFDFGKEQVDTSRWVSLCPLKISNASHEPLLFKRLALKVPYLSLYAGADQLYTNELSVIFKGPDQESQVRISTRTPVVGEALVKTGDPRRKKDKELLKKGVTFFRSLYSF
jgi:hypothetical protein